MLKIKFREEEAAHPLQALCPWMDLITPQLVLNKDGSILAGFSYTGVDPDNLYIDLVNASTAQMERAYNQLDERVTAWWIVDKRRDNFYPVNTFTNQTAAAIDKIYSKGFLSGEHYRTTYHFYMLFSGSSGTDKLFDAVARIQSETGASLSNALISAIKESLSGRTAFARDLSSLEENVLAFERIIANFTNSCQLKFSRLDEDELSSSLACLLNRATTPNVWRKPKGAMLDSWAPQNYVSSSKEVIKFTGNDRTVYGAALSVGRWPKKTSPMLFESLAKLDMELTICQIVRFLGAQKSESAIQQAVQYYELTQYGMISHMLAKASGADPTPSPGKAELLKQCEAAKTRIGAEDLNYVYHNVTIFVYADNTKNLKSNVSTASQRLSNLQFVAIRERNNTLPSFAAMLPGQWAMQCRYELMTVENVADLTPLYTMGEGSRVSPYLSSELVYKRPVSALSMFGTSYGGTYSYNPHVGQNGHMLIVAPTGGGKTTFVNFSLSQFYRYEDVQVFIFDRNKSCKIVTEMHGGKHIDISTGTAKWNPFFAMKDGSEDGQNWVREFVLRRLAEGGFKATAEDRAAIDDALTKLSKEPNANLSMSGLAMLLPKRIESELGEWLEGRPYGMFDSQEDDFSFSSWTTIEMKEIMAIDRLGRAFMDYAFRKIYASLDGRPTFIYLEEASFLLKNPAFKDMIDDWLKTFRKKNAFLWLTIQSPESISSDEMAATLLDNIPSFLMCVNRKVESHREAYKKYFGLEEHQVDQIARLQPNRDYLLVQGTDSKVLRTNFSRECLAYLRSEESMLKTFDRHKASNDPDWQKNYIREAQSS